MSDHENLLLKLRQEASGYSPTQQKLGEFVLNDPARVLYLTITELARESGTSEASVSAPGESTLPVRLRMSSTAMTAPKVISTMIDTIK